MPQVIDIEREMAPLTLLEERHADSSEDDLAAAFATLAVYRDGGIFAGGFSGMSDWERHRNGDEIVQVLGGATTITIVTESGPETFERTAGRRLVVPQGCWHRFQGHLELHRVTDRAPASEELTVPAAHLWVGALRQSSLEVEFG